MQPLQPEDPNLIGKYQLLARLGSGGMGRVYLGRSPGGRLVAIKLVRPELAESAEFRKRFAREVNAARTVGGMYTATVVDADPGARAPWLVTAYIDGSSLADAVAAHGPLPVTSVLHLAAGLAEGLCAIHAAGLVHRDLKPSNVLLAGDGPRIIDFGISRAMDAAGATGTMSGTVLGSPGFMAPEQAEGHEVGPPSDIFSLGALLAFSASGHGPFGEGSTPALIYRVVHGEPDIAGLPGGIRPLIERCLSKRPLWRPTSQQILDELGTAAPTQGLLPWPVGGATPGAAAPGIAAPPAVRGPAPAPPGRNPTELAGPAHSTPPYGATADSANGQGAARPGPHAAPGQPPPSSGGHGQPPVPGGPARPPPHGRRRRRVVLAGAAAAILAACAAAAALVSTHDAGQHHEGGSPAAAARPAASSPAPAAPAAAPSGTAPGSGTGGSGGASAPGAAPSASAAPSSPASGSSAGSGGPAGSGNPAGPGRQGYGNPAGSGRPAGSGGSAGSGAAPPASPASSAPAAGAAPGASPSPSGAAASASAAPPAATSPSSSGTAAGGGSSPLAVVQDYYAAINERDWQEVWQLGGDNLSPGYAQMVRRFQATSEDVITSISASGSTVSVTVDAYQTDGTVLTFSEKYVVSNGVIVSASGSGS